MKGIGNYTASGNILADMLICIWSFKSSYRRGEWHYAGYDQESYDRAQEGLKALGLINKRDALMPKTKKALKNAGFGQKRVEVALSLL